MSFKVYRQLDRIDCGPTCLRMIAKHYGRIYSREYLREQSYITRDGVSINGLSEAAETIGLRSLPVKVGMQTLIEEVPLPCIAHWRQRHFVVIYKVTKSKIYVADPDFGQVKYSHTDFAAAWINNSIGNASNEGFLLLLEPTPAFYDIEAPAAQKLSGFKTLLPYFKPFKRYVNQLSIGLLVGTCVQVTFPFLTQSIVDKGIKDQNIGFIYIVLSAQLMLFFSLTLIEMFRGWLLLHMGSRINISIVSDFLMKLMRLPLSFFDSRRTGDILQRIEDNHRIEAFLSSVSLTVLFSFFNLIIFSSILAFYNLKIFLVFITGAVLYMLWVVIFMKKRAVLDYKRFDELAGSTSSIMQLINGIQEIKLNNSERRRRWEWESIQAKLFKISVKGLALAQYQSVGGNFINELKNIIITFIAAHAVITGEITLGTMLAIQYMIAQMNGPLANFISFIQRSQDASISLERLGEIRAHPDENVHDEATATTLLIPYQDINICDSFHFRYGGSDSKYILNDLNFRIPCGQITAIVGASGSGKTTLLKLLLKFYKPTSGSIKIGLQDLNCIPPNIWRDHCGVVMQDGFIFSDSIARNITESSSEGIIDRERLLYAVKVANLTELIEMLPAGYNTKIGVSGLQLSGGQKQRILIARAVYKNPEFLFFDEATSSLDANNEKIIMENLYEFFKGKTVVVIAHRLSTVKNADKIVVLHQGSIIEEGRHEDLTVKRGAYFTLVKNQLELGD